MTAREPDALSVAGPEVDAAADAWVAEQLAKAPAVSAAQQAWLGEMFRPVIDDLAAQRAHRASRAS